MTAELAEFEGLTDLMVATESDYEAALFGDNPAARALVAELGDEVVGYAIYFRTFSTFIGKAGIWLEDLYVRADHRQKGIGKALLKAVGTVAEESGAQRYEWSVLDWSQNAIDVYERMGGEILNEWRIVRMDRKALEALSKK